MSKPVSVDVRRVVLLKFLSDLQKNEDKDFVQRVSAEVEKHFKILTGFPLR